ncbi:hypothetical protein FACS1894217_05590 [Clostridia bacterium]|nr:hypothetical protein FACS1894217_05590 [Clostridia bacterium]
MLLNFVVGMISGGAIGLMVNHLTDRKDKEQYKPLNRLETAIGVSTATDSLTRQHEHIQQLLVRATGISLESDAPNLSAQMQNILTIISSIEERLECRELGRYFTAFLDANTALCAEWKIVYERNAELIRENERLKLEMDRENENGV